MGLLMDCDSLMFIVAHNLQNPEEISQVLRRFWRNPASVLLVLRLLEEPVASLVASVLNGLLDLQVHL